ncbi:unnamed protein product [Schistocephalus solidus]|uniref:EGF-like domain-containing protein n=1 Tax=Schistocephalus solidus TaxID=70667 RepID=A0A3P7CMV6_SCHSO|nr:unnamed protein product [Schistocephalus solidus]
MPARDAAGYAGFTLRSTDLSLQSELLSCRSNPCKNGATCTDLDSGGYYCSCTDRWGGQNCTEEALTCDHQPCLNGGYCTELPNRQYKCDCRPGFVGTSGGLALLLAESHFIGSLSKLTAALSNFDRNVVRK